MDLMMSDLDKYCRFFATAFKSKQCSLICQTSDTPFSLQGSIGIHCIHSVIHMECLWKYGATHLMCLDQPVSVQRIQSNCSIGKIIYNQENVLGVTSYM